MWIANGSENRSWNGILGRGKTKMELGGGGGTACYAPVLQWSEHTSPVTSWGRRQDEAGWLQLGWPWQLLTLRELQARGTEEPWAGTGSEVEPEDQICTKPRTKRHFTIDMVECQSLDGVDKHICPDLSELSLRLVQLSL